jgi:hypothetical protein
MANDEGFTEKSLKSLQVIGFMKNKWRRRTVVVCQHPTREDDVVSIATPFDGGEIIVCVDSKSDYDLCIKVFPKTFVFN